MQYHTDILALLAVAFPDLPITGVAPTIGGFSHLTAQLMIGDQHCIIKAASATLKRADIRHEAAVLALLHNAPLPIPRVRALIDDAAWTIAVTDAIPGTHGLAVLEHTPEALVTVYRALGQLMATIHRYPLASPAPDMLLATRLNDARQRVPMLDLEPELRALLLASLEQVLAGSSPITLVHGDLGLHNLLWDGQRPTLLDWEWAGWGDPRLDLAWLYWTIQWRKLPNAVWEAFLDGYAPGRAHITNTTPAQLHALAIGQIASILVRVQDIPPAWAEWVRRLHWTRDLGFPI